MIWTLKFVKGAPVIWNLTQRAGSAARGIMVRIDFNRLRFLVIDDNAHMHGFGAREVYEAEDGAAGLKAFTHYYPISWSPTGPCRSSTGSSSRR